MEVDLGKRSEMSSRYRKKNHDAWKEQHRDIYKKWLNQAVFATPLHPKATSNRPIKNSYFRLLTFPKFWLIVVTTT